MVIEVSTHGPDVVSSDAWMVERLDPELRRREIRTTGVGLGACTMGDSGLRLSTDDWNAVDPIA